MVLVAGAVLPLVAACQSVDVQQTTVVNGVVETVDPVSRELLLRGDGGWSLSGLITIAQLVAAAMVLAGGLLWLHRPHATQVSHGE